MSNTVITNYTDLNGPSTKTDSSVVVIVNKDGSLSVDQKLLGTLMGSDGSQAAGISVVRVGHEGRPDDATDSESEDEKIPHVTLSVDSYYDEPDSIIKYDSGAEMLQSLRIETRENSLVGFHNDHCYTPLTSPSQSLPQKHDTLIGYDEPVIEISHTLPPKPVATPKKITIIEQQIIPKGKKILINPKETPLILKGNDLLNKALPTLTKAKSIDEIKSDKSQRLDEPSDSSSACSSGESPVDRDSDSDYKDTKDKSTGYKVKTKLKSKPRILKSVQSTKSTKLEPKLTQRFKANKNLLKKDLKERVLTKNLNLEKKGDLHQMTMKNMKVISAARGSPTVSIDPNKLFSKITPKPIKKEKKTPAHMTALLSDMTALFSTPDVIRRVSTETKLPSKPEKETVVESVIKKTSEISEKVDDTSKLMENIDQPKSATLQKTCLKQMKLTNVNEKSNKNYDPIPQLDDVSLAQILQDSTPTVIKSQPSISTASVINSPGLAGPLSPTLDLLAGLQPEEDGLTEDLLMHVAQLVESSENLQEVIDKQVLGKVDTVPVKSEVTPSTPQTPTPNVYVQTPIKSTKTIQPRKDPIEIIRRDGRVITLPPIEAPATRASKRKTQVEAVLPAEPIMTPITNSPKPATPEPIVPQVSKQYSNKKLANKKQEQVPPPPAPPTPPQAPIETKAEIIEKMSAESQESWNSEDDPNRLWCICKQPHNNRFMICCDGCEDWFHGKCVNITKAMGQQMEEQGIEWRCPNCVKKTKTPTAPIPKNPVKTAAVQKDSNKEVGVSTPLSANTKEVATKTTCIVCKKAARASSIYCSDGCILKHAQDSLGAQASTSRNEIVGGKVADKQNSESRVIVYERKTGRLLAGPNAPTAENLKSWLQKNPTFEVVRPGTLSTIKPNLVRKKASEPNKIQTTLNFVRIPKKTENVPIKKQPEPKEKEKVLKVSQITTPTEEITPPPKTPGTPRLLQTNMFDTPKSSKPQPEPKKFVRATTSRTQTPVEKPSVTPSTSRRKDTPDRRQLRMGSEEPIRDNVRKALQEQMCIRMRENQGSKFTDEEIREFAYEAESELHDLFNRDVGMKYKAKYRSLMFNIKDRKNLSLWEKICDRTITPKQLVRLSPEELASQELAQWRDKEAKYQLELIKKSELDLLAASKTYVLKTHKGEEVMETKESVSTEVDPNVAVEDLVTVLNDAAGDTPPIEEPETPKKEEIVKKNNKKKDKDSGVYLKKKDQASIRDLDARKSRSSKRKSEAKVKEHRSSRRSGRRSSRSERKFSRSRSKSKDRSKRDKSDSRERSRHRSRSRERSKRKSREHSRSISRGREQTRASKRRSSRRLSSRDSTKQKRRRRSRSKHRQISPEDKLKHRSKSQDTVNRKIKNDSTDSDSIERPKSAMMKEPHPEYDPHEPMITSAFSEDDLRKSKEDVYDETYKNDVGDYGVANYDSTKAFSIGSSILADRYIDKQDKSSEVESDQEPTSTMESSVATVWNGCINMVDVARFYVAAHEVSGNAIDLEEDLTPELDIVGRINPDTVWDYINKMKRASNKDIVILRLQAANDEEKMQYIALYSYLSSRNRLGVVKVSNTATVKDLYIVPLAANTPLPAVLLPLDGPGLADSRTHLLVAIIIRQRNKRRAPSAHPAPHIPKDAVPAVPAKMVRESRKKSYTPPLSPRHRTLPLPTYTSPALSISVKDKIAATLASADDEEAYSPGSSTGSSSSNNAIGPPTSNTLRNKMEELNRQIEEQKQQILKMAQADSASENEAYSPSRPLTPPTPVVPLSDISLPSNLQEILATIKQRSENVNADIDMRTMPMS